jgi:hypothetical protein
MREVEEIRGPLTVYDRCPKFLARAGMSLSWFEKTHYFKSVGHSKCKRIERWALRGIERLGL